MLLDCNWGGERADNNGKNLQGTLVSTRNITQIYIKQEGLQRYHNHSSKQTEILTKKQQRVDNCHHCDDLNLVLNLCSSLCPSPQINLQVAAEEPGGAQSTH